MRTRPSRWKRPCLTRFAANARESHAAERNQITRVRSSSETTLASRPRWRRVRASASRSRSCAYRARSERSQRTPRVPNRTVRRDDATELWTPDVLQPTPRAEMRIPVDLGQAAHWRRRHPETVAVLARPQLRFPRSRRDLRIA